MDAIIPRTDAIVYAWSPELVQVTGLRNGIANSDVQDTILKILSLS